MTGLNHNKADHAAAYDNRHPETKTQQNIFHIKHCVTWPLTKHACNVDRKGRGKHNIRQLDIKHALYIGIYASSKNVDDRGTFMCDNIWLHSANIDVNSAEACQFPAKLSLNCHII